MNAFRSFVAWVGCALLCLSLVGCGSGGGTSGGNNFDSASNGSNATVSGRLYSSSVQLNDGSYADLYQVSALAGGSVSVTMKSSSLHPYLLLYTLNSDGSLGSKVAEAGNSGSASSTTLNYTVTQGQGYLLVADALNAGETGAYTLSVSSNFGSVQATAPPSGGSGSGSGTGIGSGTTLSGQLTTRDSVSSAGQYFKLYTCSAVTSGNATITMQSSALDCALAVLRINSDGSTTTVAINNGVNGNTHLSRVTFAVTSGAQYAVGASTSQPGEMGSFTLAFSAALGNVQLQNGRAASLPRGFALPLSSSKEVIPAESK